MCRTILLKLTAVCLISSTVPSATALLTAVNAAQAMGLLSRASSSCSLANFTPCSQMPSDFCCPSGTQCQVFNNAASVVCCPSGLDCKTIAPITCDITQQNATLHPSNQLHSTDLSGKLEACGNACCPKGFSCQNGQCNMKTSVSSSAAPAAAASSSTLKVSTASTKPTSSATSSSSSSSSSKASSNTSTQPTSSASSQPFAQNGTAHAHCDKFPATAIIAGALPGLLLGVLLTLLAIICLGRHRSSPRNSIDLGSITASVSDPIYMGQNNAVRTDFLRRQSRSNNRTSRVRSIFSRSPTIRNTDGAGRSINTPVRTPEMRKEPSTESIKIYSPPNGGFERPQTTFTDMMADAGFKPGEPYLGTPVRNDPRARGGGGR